MKKILINASNLHNGGGIQVAVSFISELINFIALLRNNDVHIYVSSAVHENLEKNNFNNSYFKSYNVINIRGLEALTKKNRIKFIGFDAVFTIFGPLYLSRRIPNHIIGFAQLWILYPRNDANKLLNLKWRVLFRLKFFIQWLFFRLSATRLIVELQHVKDRLVSFKKYPADRIDVINNCIAGFYFDLEKWAPLPLVESLTRRTIKIGYISRSYPHKNLLILLAVARQLEKISNLHFDFFVTLNDAEWSSFPVEFQSKIFNIGPLEIMQCPTFYKSMDGVIFTSLLECFSATPLEAMAMKRPLFASDRKFVRDCCGDNAIYFDPLSSVDIAEKINQWFNYMPIEEREKHVENAYQHVISLPNSKDRAASYIGIINQQLSNALA